MCICDPIVIQQWGYYYKRAARPYYNTANRGNAIFVQSILRASIPFALTWPFC